jgi:chemotaxis response regulator CheB
MQTTVQTTDKPAEPSVAQRAPDRFRKLEKDAFDAIVVGAGTGGLTALEPS